MAFLVSGNGTTDKYEVDAGFVDVLFWLVLTVVIGKTTLRFVADTEAEDEEITVVAFALPTKKETKIDKASSEIVEINFM